MRKAHNVANLVPNDRDFPKYMLVFITSEMVLNVGKEGSLLLPGLAGPWRPTELESFTHYGNGIWLAASSRLRAHGEESNGG